MESVALINLKGMKMNKLPTIKLHDNFLDKDMTLYPSVYISSEGRLVICYESEPENYADFGNDDKSWDWSIGGEKHLTIKKLI